MEPTLNQFVDESWDTEVLSMVTVYPRHHLDDANIDIYSFAAEHIMGD